MGPTTLVLASGSPRRRELLGRLGVPFEVRPPDIDESARPDEAPADLVARLAREKAEAALGVAAEPDVVVLAADTVVTLDETVLAKPVDDADATRMLELLSARTHVVLTGVAVARRTAATDPDDADPDDADPDDADPDAGDPGGGVALGPSVALAVEVVATEVTFVELRASDVAWYVATGEPADKAGAYGIQGSGAVLVSSIRGSHDNVVGLPLAVVRRLLAELGVDPLDRHP